MRIRILPMINYANTRFVTDRRNEKRIIKGVAGGEGKYFLQTVHDFENEPKEIHVWLVISGN